MVDKGQEYLSKDILDEDFINTFNMVYNFQRYMASSRIYVKNRFVTAPTLLQKCHTIFNVVSILALNIYIVEKYVFNLSENKAVYYLSTGAIGLQSVTFICNVIHVRFFNGEANANFYVKLQIIDRCMKIEHNVSINKISYTIYLLTIGIVLAMFCPLLFVAATKSDLGTFLSFAGSIYTQSCFVLELICCSDFIIHFFIRTSFINAIIENHIKQTKLKPISSRTKLPISICSTKMFMRQLANETHNFYLSETDVYLREIFDGFSKFRDIYQFQVCVFCCKLVLSCLITFEFLIYGVQNNTMSMLESMTPAIFTAIDLLIAVILGVRSELFFREVKETKRLAIKVLSLHHEGRLRDTAKKMLKMIEETPPRFSVYEMWQLNANILLSMFALVTSLVLTQLQFAFL